MLYVSIETLLKDWILYLFNKAFWQNFVWGFYYTNKQKIGQKFRENIRCDFFGFYLPVSKLKWVTRQNQAILEQNEEKIGHM